MAQQELLCEDDSHPGYNHHHGTPELSKGTRSFEHSENNFACAKRNDPIYRKADVSSTAVKL